MCSHESTSIIIARKNTPFGLLLWSVLLGAWITENGKSRQAIKSRLGMARDAFEKTKLLTRLHCHLSKSLQITNFMRPDVCESASGHTDCESTSGHTDHKIASDHIERKFF